MKAGDHKVKAPGSQCIVAPRGITSLMSMEEAVEKGIVHPISHAWPHVIKPGETITISFPMPPLPCKRCGVDLRGKKGYLIDPHPVDDEDDHPANFETSYDGRTAYHLSCDACFEKEPSQSSDRLESQACPVCLGHGHDERTVSHDVIGPCLGCNGEGTREAYERLDPD